MPKMKTNSSAKKRFRVTKKGKVMRGHAYHSHLLTKKSKKRKKNLVKIDSIAKADEKRMKRLLTV
jgi:large subunit ribosomal protein L35